MRWKEIRNGPSLRSTIALTFAGIDVFPPSHDSHDKPASLGKSPHAGTLAVSQTAASRVMVRCAISIDRPS